MGRNPQWVGDNRRHLVTESLPELYARFPDYPKSKLRAERSYWKKKEKMMEGEPTGSFGEILKLHNITPELAQEFTEQGFHVGYIKNNEGEIEYTIPLPNARRQGTQSEEQSFVTQAQPIRIAPDRRRPVKRDFHRYFDFPDIQLDFRDTPEGIIPTHNEGAMRVARMLCHDLRPDTIVIGGDNLDMAAFSKFDKDSTHFDGPNNLQRALDALHKYLAEIRADNPNARIVMLEGNHDFRLRREILRTNSRIAGVRQANDPEAWPVMSLPFLLHLEDLSIEYFDGYPANEFWAEEDLVFIHGKEVRSNGSTAEVYSRKYPDADVVFHHVHRHETHTRTTRHGKVLTSTTNGTLCDTTGPTSSYHNGVGERGNVMRKQENWVNAVGVIDSYQEGRTFKTIYIRSGLAVNEGKIYSSDE